MADARRRNASAAMLQTSAPAASTLGVPRTSSSERQVRHPPGGVSEEGELARRAPRAVKNVMKQLKYVVGGALVVWWFDVATQIRNVYESDGWASRLLVISLAFGAATVGLFLYLLMLPYRGITPDYPNWRISPPLSYTIPLLTFTILCGLLSLFVTLSVGDASRLGWAGAALGSLASYALAFGIIGLLPAKTRAD